MRNIWSEFLAIVRSRLLKQSALYMLGQVLQRAVALLLIPVWTVFLTPEDYGIIGTLSAYGQIAHILLSAGVYGAVTQAYFEYKNTEVQRAYVFSNAIFLFLSTTVAVGLAILFGRPWWNRITNNTIPFAPFAILMLISVWSGILYRLIYSLWQAQQRVRTCVAAEFAIFIATTGISLTLVVGWKMGAYGQTLGNTLTQTFVGVVAITLLCRNWATHRIHWDHVKASLLFGMPLVPHLLSHWVLSFADRVMLTNYVPLSQVGLYNLGYNLGMVMLVVVTGINEAFQPYYFARMSSEGNADVPMVRIISAYMVCVGLLALFGSLFAPELIALLTPPKYEGAAQFVPPVLLGYLLVGLYFFVSSPLFYYKKTHLLPLITAAGAVLNIGLNVLLLPRYGAVASAWNTLASYALLLALYYLAAQRVAHTVYPLPRYLMLLVLLIVSVIFAQFVQPLTSSGILMKAAVCLTYGLLSYRLLLDRSTSFAKQATRALDASS